MAASGGIGCALLLPLAVRGEVEAVVILARRREGGDLNLFDERAVQSAATLVDQAATALALLRARAEAGTDPVTGCMNHRAMRRRLNEEIGRANRTDGRLACLLIDLDNFKLVNDRHGHSAGDMLLREVAQALMGEFRAFDRVARYGGDEFVVILAGADLESATIAAERARERMREVASFDVDPGRVSIHRRGPVARADEHRHAARRLRRRAPAAQARGQGACHSRGLSCVRGRVVPRVA